MTDVVEVAITSDTSEKNWNASVWDPRAGTTLMSYKGGSAAPRTLSLLGLDYLLAAEPGKPILRAWALNKNDQISLRMTCPGIVTALTCTPDGFYCIAGVGEKLCVWQTATGCMLTSVSGHYQTVTCLAFTDDGALVVSGSEDCQALVWELSRLVARTELGSHTAVSEVTPLHTFNHHNLGIRDICIGKGGVQTLMASVSLDQCCKVYSLASGVMLLNIVFNVGLSAVALHPMSTEIYVGSSVGCVYSCELTNVPRTPDFHIPNEYPRVFNSDGSAITCLSVSMDGLLLLSGCKGEKAIIWDIPSRQMLHVLPHKGVVSNAFFTIAPTNVFSEHLKANIVLKSLTAFEMKPTEVLCHNGGWCSSEMSQLVQEQNEILQGELYSRQTFTQTSSHDVHKLKQINQELFKFAVNKLLTPTQPVEHKNSNDSEAVNACIETCNNNSSKPSKKRKLH